MKILGTSYVYHPVFVIKYATSANNDKKYQLVQNNLDEKKDEAIEVLMTFRRIEPKMVRTQMLYFDNLYPLERPIELKNAFPKTHTNSFEILFHAVSLINGGINKINTKELAPIEIEPDFCKYMIPIKESADQLNNIDQY